MIKNELNDIIVVGIKRLRKDLNLSQNELANKLNLSESYIIKWENKQTAVSLKNLMHICDKCNCSLDYLFGRSDNMNNDLMTADMAYKYVFNVEFSLLDNDRYFDSRYDNDFDYAYSINLTTDKYILEYFYNKSLLEQKKEQDQITQEVFDFKQKKLREKYSKVFNQELSKKVKYNCTKIGEY